MIRVTHVITSLGAGGAEMMLYKLVSGMDRSAFDCSVVSLTENGPVGRKIEGLGIAVHTLGMKRGSPSPRALFQLAQILRDKPPHLIQTWMYHADLLGSLAGRLAGGPPVAWNIRTAKVGSREAFRRTTVWIAKTCALLAGSLPERIVCCGEAARQHHIDFGYAGKKMVVIGNGFDVDQFKPDPAARRGVREELGIAEDVPVVGLIGRFHEQKDHRNFVQAAQHLASRNRNVRFLLCGDGVTAENTALAAWISEAGIGSRCHLLGSREDVARIMAALDIATLSSETEGFPNVIGEAMATELPCAVTNAGDAAYLVGDTGKVVPCKHPEALAQACQELLELSPAQRSAIGAAARNRIKSHFSLNAVVSRYQSLYQEIIADVRNHRVH